MSTLLKNDGTKPFNDPSNLTEQSQLTSRQAAAARLFATGLRSADVASQLATTQRSVNRWKKLAGFQIELRRIQNLLVIAPAQRTVPPAAPALPRFAPMARKTQALDDDAEIEGLIDQVLRHARSAPQPSGDR
jgi:hypothetical protein